MASGIYAITSPSGGQYVGSAVNLIKRRCNHLHLLRNGKHDNRALQRAYNKYGPKRLKFTVLRVCKPESLIRYEQRAIDMLKPRYNACSIAGSQLGMRHSEKTKKLMSRLKLGRVGTRLNQSPSKTTRKKISKTLKGRPHVNSFITHVTPNQKKQIIRAYLSGTGYAILAAQYRTAHQTMKHLLISEGVRIRPPEGNKNPSFDLRVTPKQRKRIVKLYLDGISMMALATKYRTAHKTIRKILISEHVRIQRSGRSTVAMRKVMKKWVKTHPAM